MPKNRHLASMGALLCVFLTQCGLLTEGDRKPSSAGLVVTPVASYSTLKARNLAQKYKENLERIVVEVVRNPTTAKLQFTNNIVSTGGIGFFTHSASQSGDERYLELILAVPEVFEEGLGLGGKIDRLMAQYGGELCAILLKESAIYGDPEVAGYGLNFFWRSAAQSGGTPQIVFERAVLYLKKDEARRFLDRKLTRDALLSGSVIFATRGNNPPQQVAYTGSAPAALSSPPAPQERPGEAAVTALNTAIKEKDLASEKERKVEEKEPKAPTKAAKKTSEKRTKPPVETRPAPVQDRPAKGSAPEAPAKSASVGTKGKAGEPATKSAGQDAAEVKSPRQDPAGARGSGTTSPPASQPAENVIASAKKPAPPSSAEKASAPLPSPGPAGEVKQQPPAPASGTSITKQTAPPSKAAPVEQPQIAAPANVPVKDKPEKITPQEKAPSATPQAKTEQAPAKSEERRPPEVKAELKDTAGTKPFSEASSSKTQSPLESGIASAKKAAPPVTGEKPAPPPEKAEPAREVKQQPITPAKDASLTSKQTPAQPKAIPAEQARIAAPTKEAIKETPAKARVEKPLTESPAAKEIKEAPRYVPEPAQPETKLTEPARTEPAPKAEPVQEATLGKDLSPEGTRPGAAGSGASRKEPQLPKDSPPPAEPVPPKQELKAKAEPLTPRTKAQPDRPVEKAAEEAGKGQLALKSVEGYVVQISFPHKTDAQRWSEVLSREGYTTSVTSIGEGESVRLRVGGFPSQALANNLLARLKKEGLNGFVVQVPKG